MKAGHHTRSHRFETHYASGYWWHPTVVRNDSNGVHRYFVNGQRTIMKRMTLTVGSRYPIVSFSRLTGETWTTLENCMPEPEYFI